MVARSPGLGWWGRLFAGAGTGDLESTWRRSANRYLAVIRLVTVPFAVALALTADEVDHAWLALVAAAAIAEMVPTGRWMTRASPQSRAPALLAILMVDLALLTAAAAASGGGDSPVLLIYPGLPLIAAIVLDPVALLILCSWCVGGRLVLGGDTTAIATFTVELVWMAAFAAALTTRRATLVRAMARVDATERALRARDHGPAPRPRLVGDLRRTAIVPAVVARDAARDASTAESFTTLAIGLRTTIAAVRAFLSELHVLAGRRDDLAVPLRRLAQRHAPTAEMTLELGPGADDHALSVATVVRDALPLVADAATASIRVAVAVHGERVVVRLIASPPPAAGGAPLPLLAVRPDVVRITTDRGDPRRLAVTIVLRHLSAARRPDLHAPGAIWATPAVALAGRLGLLTTIVGVALLSGGTDPWFWPILGAEGLNLALLPLLAMAGRATRAVYVVGAAVDVLLIGGILLLAGDAAAPLLAVAVVLPATVAAVLSSGWTAVATVLAASGVPLTIDVAQPAFTIAVGWSGIVGIGLALFTTAVAKRLNRVRRERNQLLTAMLWAEESERRRLAQSVHDDALQLLLVATQELDEAAAGDPVAADAAVAALERAIAAAELVATDLAIDEGAPALPGGLSQALQSVATPAGPTLRLEVDPAASGIHDGLLVATSRELYRNASRHGGAATVTLTVARSDDAIVLDASDDGVGFDRDRVDDAVARGHLGLATIRERAARAGGSVTLLDAAGGGARVRLTLPADVRTP